MMEFWAAQSSIAQLHCSRSSVQLARSQPILNIVRPKLDLESDFRRKDQKLLFKNSKMQLHIPLSLNYDVCVPNTGGTARIWAYFS